MEGERTNLKFWNRWVETHAKGQASRPGSYICEADGAVVYSTDRKAKRHHPKGHRV